MPNQIKILSCLLLLLATKVNAQSELIKPDTLTYKPFTWISEPPKDCPFEQSKSLVGILFLGMKSGFHYGDTWYPTWAANDTLYSPWTDGTSKRLDGYDEKANSGYAAGLNGTDSKTNNTTGQGVMIGDDPLTLKAYSIGTYNSPSFPYQGRYPCGSLVYNGVWYYGTYVVGSPFLVRIKSRI